MYPGQTTRLTYNTQASATTIQGNADFIKLTGTTDIATIAPKLLNKGGMCTIIRLLPLNGNINTTAAGNIIAAITMLQNRVTMLVWDPTTGKWYPHALA